MEMAQIRWFSYGTAVLAVALIGTSLFVAKNPKVVAATVAAPTGIN